MAVQEEDKQTNDDIEIKGLPLLELDSNQSVENAMHDGAFNKTQFKDPRFNEICAGAAIGSVMSMMIYHPNKPLTIIDAGAGEGDLTIALKKKLEAKKRQSTSVINVSRSVPLNNIRLIMADIDERKLITGRQSLPIGGLPIIPEHTDILKIHERESSIDLENPAIVLERAVLQYFTDPGYTPSDPSTWPEKGYTQAQKDLMLYYAKILYKNGGGYPGSKLVFIESTGADETGLRMFECMLERLTDGGKKDRFLTRENFIDLVNAADDELLAERNGSRRARLDLAQREINSIDTEIGHRNINYHYERYGIRDNKGNHTETYYEFRERFFDYYDDIKQMFPDGTEMFEEIQDENGEPDLLIKVNYNFYVVDVKSRR